MALKGAYLAWHSYPSPDLRPIRDLDILVPPEQVLRAYDILLAGGFEKVDGEHGEPEAILAVYKHLPAIKRPESSVKLELHAQLFNAAQRETIEHELSRQPGFWARAIPQNLADQVIYYPSPTDQLLHLLVHAVADHKLNNGPLILTDVYYLLKQQGIDWPLFWQLAGTIQQLPAAILGLQLANYHWGNLPIQWINIPGTMPNAAFLASLRSFCLSDFSVRSDVYLAHRLAAGWAERLSWLREQIMPSPAELAVRYPTHNNWMLPYWYARRWFDGLMRLAGMLNLQPNTLSMRPEIAVLRQLDDWLTSPINKPHQSGPSAS